MFFVNLRIFLERDKVFQIMLGCYLLIISAVVISLFFCLNNLNATLIENGKVSNQYNALSAELDSKNSTMYEGKLKASFSGSQLNKISQTYMKYYLYINGEEFKTSPVYSKAPNVSVVLSEVYDKSATDVLPEDIIESGSILNIKDASKLIKISSNSATVNTSIGNEDNKKWLTYNFSNVKIGEIITLEVDPSTAKKIGLDDNIIEIIYNGEK